MSRPDLHIGSSSPPCRRQRAPCNPSRPRADFRKRTHWPAAQSELRRARQIIWCRTVRRGTLQLDEHHSKMTSAKAMRDRQTR